MLGRGQEDEEQIEYLQKWSERRKQRQKDQKRRAERRKVKIWFFGRRGRRSLLIILRESESSDAGWSK